MNEDEPPAERIEEEFDIVEDEHRSSRVSRRGMLGLAGLVGLGAIGAGSQSVAAVEGYTLEQDLDCNGFDLDGVRYVKPSDEYNYFSILTNGEGSGNLQLYDDDDGSPFLRASEDPASSGPGPIQFNAPIMGVPEDAYGSDIDPGPLQIADDVDHGGNELRAVGAIAGDVTDGERLESLAGDNIAISDGQLNAVGGEISDDLETRLDDAVTRLEVVGGTANQWHVGPTEPVGEYHGQSSWGTLIETDRSAYFGECTIETNEAGQFTPALYEYDPDSDTLGEQVDSITIQSTGDRQTIFLDFLVDEPGEYLLTRLIPEANDGSTGSETPDDLWKPVDDPLTLQASSDYSGFADDSQNGITLKGGYNPYTTLSEPNDRWYYYFDLEISSAENA